ncbi:MAG TPA: hypothetical protein VI298_16010 [Geobacteraceae bacterium]
MLELIRARLKDFFAANICKEPEVKNNKRSGFKIKNRLGRILTFIAPQFEKRFTLYTANTRNDQLVARYKEICEIRAITINTLEECIEIQSRTIVSFERTEELQDETIRLLKKHVALNEVMIVQLIDRLEMASQKYDDPKLIYEGLLFLREELLIKGDVIEGDS